MSLASAVIPFINTYAAIYLRINVKDIISDHTSKRTKLQAKKQRLEAFLTRARLPLRELKPFPVNKFQTELVALKQAQFQLDVIARQVQLN